MRKPRVILVVGNDLVVHGLNRLFELDGHIEVLGRVATVTEGVELCRFCLPDAILIDHSSAKLGSAPVKTLRAYFPDMKIAVLSSSRLAEEEVMRSGADLFISTDMTTDCLIGRIRSLFPGCMESASIDDLLSSRELRVAQLVALGMTNAEVAGALFISPNTVKTHLGRVLSKLGVRDRVQLAREWGQEARSR